MTIRDGLRIAPFLFGALTLLAETPELASPNFHSIRTAPPSITTTSPLPAMASGIAYSDTLAATGTAPMTWAVTSGTLPGGLSLNAATGVISGTPATATAATITVKASNAYGSSSKQLVLPASVAPAITVSSPLAAATQSNAYSVSLTASGTAPIAWSVTGGALPPGLAINTSTGVVSGTPTAAGNFTFTVTATNAAGSASAALSLTVNGAASAYYVSVQQGNDSWSGLLPAPNATNTDGPYKTVTRAQGAMESSKIKAAVLRAGTYAVTGTWTLTASDDGELWLPYPGESVIFNGAGSGTISILSAVGVQLEGFTFENLAAGMGLGGDNQIVLRWNTFQNCLNTCIYGGANTNTVIDSNTFNGQTPGNVPGSPDTAYSAIMFDAGTNATQITHNLFENLQGGGIQFATGSTGPSNSNNIVDRNIFTNVCTNVSDMGAIYMMDRFHAATGNQITNNIIEGNGGTAYQTNSTKAIYLDDLMANVTVSGNLCSACGEFAWQIHGGDHNTITNNIFDLSTTGTQIGLYQNDPGSPDYGMTANTIENNVVYFAGAPPSALYQVNLTTEQLPFVSNQLYYSATGATPSDPVVIDQHPVYQNPEFTNPAASNYSMPATSPVYTLLQFTPLVTNQGPLPYAPPLP